MRISACMIVRDAAHTVERALASVRPHVDEIVVVDTGSTDETLAIVAKYADRTETYLGPSGDWATRPFIDDFAAARNRSFDLATGDWLFWLDADDELIGGAKLRDLARAGTADAYFLHYTYAHDGQGVVFCELYRERLMRRSVVTGWTGRVHEVCGITPGAVMATLPPSEIDVKHWPDARRTHAPADRNRAILESMLEQDGPSPRLLYYLGREYRAKDWTKSVQFFEQLLRRGDGAPEERYQAAHMAADLYRAVGNYADADRLDGWALAILPEWADADFGLAECAYYRRDWARCIAWTERGLAKGVPQTTAIINPLDYLWSPYLFYNFALNQVGRVEEAMRACETALRVQAHPQLLANLGWYRRHFEVLAVKQRTLALIDDYRRYDEWVKLKAFLDVVPHVVEEHAEIEQARTTVAERMALIEDKVAYERVYGQGEVFPWQGAYDDVGQRLPRVGWAESWFTKTGAKVILDAGCADGFAAIYLAKRGFTVHAVEMNPRAVEVGKAAAVREGVADRITWYVAAIEAIPTLGMPPVDGVMCFETLEHVADPGEALRAIESVCAPDARVCLCVPHGEWEPNPKSLAESVPGHLRAFTPKSLRAVLVGRHQVEIESRPSGNPSLPYQAHLWATYRARPSVDVLIPTRFPDRPVQQYCRAALERVAASHRLIWDDGEGTFAEKVNRLVRRSTAPYVLVLNDDVEVFPGTIERMVAWFAEDVRLGVLGMFSNCDQGWHHQESLGGIGIEPSLTEVQARHGWLEAEAERRAGAYRGRALDVPWVAFYGVMIRREVFETVGDLDERCQNYGEDADFCARATRAGWAVRYALDGLLVHFGGTTLRALPTVQVRAQKRASKRWLAVKANLPSVAIVAPLVWSPWSPRVLAAHGCGGSETAAIHMARELTRLGHRVDVFNQCDGARFYEGVGYWDWSTFRPGLASVVVAWRAPEVADAMGEPDHAYLWMHDWDVGDRLTEARARRFDAVLALSQAHRAHLLARYPFLSETQVRVTRNGVDLSRFAGDAPVREAKRVIYSSSPDRGLDILLTFWPHVRARVPDATLHVFYGWKGIDLAVQRGFAHLAEFKTTVEALAQQPGVLMRDAVPQRQLAVEMRQTSIWCYPTYFTETSCMTAMEAQLAGVYPITRPLAALTETVIDGTLIDGDVHDPQVQAQYVEALVTRLTEGVGDAWREKVAAEARARFGWEPVARQWSRWFTEAD